MIFDDDDVSSVEADCRIKLEGGPGRQLHVHNTTLDGANLWNLDHLDSDYLDSSYNDGGATGEDALIYVLDTGISIDHSEFQGGRALGGWSAGCEERPCRPGYAYQGVLEADGSTCGSDHGTHCASIAVGKRYGVAKKATVVSVQILDCHGGGHMSDLLAGIEWAVLDAEARGKQALLSVSIVGSYFKAVNSHIKVAYRRGFITVAAAGNAHANACNYSPPGSKLALTVGAMEASNAISPYSNYGSCIDIFAPGSAILSAGLGSRTASTRKSGTSMAAPHVAAAIA